MSIGALDTVSKPLSRFFKLFQTPRPIQVGALCYRCRAGKTEILLITTRKSKRWILPKGNPIDGMTNAQAACQEAYEEAGVKGIVNDSLIDIVQISKKHGKGYRRKIDLHIYALNVTSQVQDFPEKGQRDIEWMEKSQAVKQCDDKAISFLLESWDCQKD